jgi:hypothetical protein
MKVVRSREHSIARNLPFLVVLLGDRGFSHVDRLGDNINAYKNFVRNPSEE